MFRDDYLMRHIEAVAQAIAHVAGLNRREEHEQALAAADAAWRELLTGPLERLDQIDSATLVSLLRTPAKLRAAALLSHHEGRALAGLGHATGAGQRYRRAMVLLLEASALDQRADDVAALAALAALVPVEALAARYRARHPGALG